MFGRPRATPGAALIGQRFTIREVSAVPNPDQPLIVALAPEEALKAAQPLPADEEMVIEGLTDEEWEAFERALADR